MRKVLCISLFWLLTSGSLFGQQPLPIRRVVIYKNGMAYIIRSGEIQSPLSLTFHPKEMNDVLKTFAAWNPNTSTLYTVGYTTDIPPKQMLERFPFALEDSNIGLAGFLRQIKGAGLRVDAGGRDLSGKLVAITREDRAVQQQTLVKDDRLTILVDDGSVRNVWLSDIRSLQLEDISLAAQLREYLGVLSDGRQDVTREITVYPTSGTSPINIAYVQQFPIWKTSYRIDMSDLEGKVQAWTQIDNPTGETWENVDLTLISGMPVSFEMNLYEPLYASRQTVQVPGSKVAAPRNYQAAVRTNSNSVAGSSMGMTSIVGGVADQISVTTSLPEINTQSASIATFQQSEAAQVQDYFEYKFPFQVRLGSRQSALLPFLNRTIKLEKVSIYSKESDSRHPQLGAILENNSGVPFDPGPVTFFQEGRYAGETVLGNVSRGEKKLVGYGVDYDIEIHAQDQDLPEKIVRIKAEKGSLTIEKQTVTITSYEIRNKSDERRILWIEHPRDEDMKLSGVSPDETTEDLYRFRIIVNPKQELTFSVKEIASDETVVSVRDLDRNRLELTFRGSEIPGALRSKFDEVIQQREKLLDLYKQRTPLDGRITTIFDDQTRLRENLKALRETTEDRELRKKYLDQLAVQEAQIADLRARINEILRQSAEQESLVEKLIAGFNWE